MDLALLVTLAAAAALVVVGLVVVLVVTRGGRRRLEAELRAARADLAALQARLAEPARTDESHAQGYLITRLSEGARQPTGPAVPDPSDDEVRRLSGGEFASVALGESLVRVASMAYGVRRALSAENRNRIRFEMSREVRRSRKQRRRDLKEAKRHLRTRQSADLTEHAA